MRKLRSDRRPRATLGSAMKRAPKLTRRGRKALGDGGYSSSGNVTHEPFEPLNWPDGHVRVELTGDDEEECVRVWIHGRTHYLHSTTARELQRMLEARLEEYNRLANSHGVPTV